MIIAVDDPADGRLDPFRWRDRQLASKLDRLETVGAGMFVAEGDLVVGRAMGAGCELIALLCDDAMAAHFAALVADVTTIFVASEPVRREVTGLGVPLRAVGLFRRPPLREPTDVVARAMRIVVVEAVDNPTNLGAIIRSAVGLGWDGLVLTGGSADPLARRALRVSMGSALSIPFARLSDDSSLEELMIRHRCRTVALTPRQDAIDIDTFEVRPDERLALLLGSERNGLEDSTMAIADVSLRIPMEAGVDSLNVAAAAAVAMHSLRQR